MQYNLPDSFVSNILKKEFEFVTGGCGFVGRHLCKRLISQQYSLLIVDDLSTGIHPKEWLGNRFTIINHTEVYSAFSADNDQVILFFNNDLMRWLLDDWDSLRQYDFSFGRIFHLASIVGGRTKIENDPMAVAIDLAIDATFYRWAVKEVNRIKHVLYASSSAAYPIHHQGVDGAVALKEEMISFDSNLGQPDMTYGWSKMTGEYLGRLAHQVYGLSVSCIRPFSGYGGDQDQTYPIPAIAGRVARLEDPLIVWGTGQQGRDFIHIDDCITGMLLATEKINDGSGVNLGTGKLTNFLEVATLFAELNGYNPKIAPLVDKPMGVNSRYADTTVMRSTLGWFPPITLKEGFGRVLAEQIQLLENQT